MSAQSPINGAARAPAALRRFILGGRAIFTMKNTKRGSHYSYQVDFKGTWPARVYGMTSGQERVIIGYINWRGAFYRVGRSPVAKDDPRHVCFSWLWDRMTARKPLPASIEVWHHGNCCRCARELTDPLSIERGFGPVCWTHVHGSLHLSARLEAVAEKLIDGVAVALPPAFQPETGEMLGKLLTLLAGVSVDQWAQARALADALGYDPAAMRQIDGIIAAQLNTINGGSAKKALAAEVAGAEVDPFWIPERSAA